MTSQLDLFSVIRRARLADMHLLPFVPSARLPDAPTLSWWQSRGFIDMNLDRSCFMLTRQGRERLQMCCGTCACWKARALNWPTGDDWGFCYSSDRGRETNPDITHETEFCEGHIDRASQNKKEV